MKNRQCFYSQSRFLSTCIEEYQAFLQISLLAKQITLCLYRCIFVRQHNYVAVMGRVHNTSHRRERKERERERERSGGRDTNSSRDYLSCCTGFRKRGYGSRRRDISQSGIIVAQVASCGIGRSGKTCKLVPKLVFLFIP